MLSPLSAQGMGFDPADYLRRDGSNTITGVLVPDGDTTRNLGSNAARLDKIFGAEIQAVDGSGTITTFGKGATFGYVTSTAEIENSSFVDGFQLVAGRAFDNTGSATQAKIQGKGNANVVLGQSYAYYGDSLLGTFAASNQANFVSGRCNTYYGTSRVWVGVGGVNGAFVSGNCYNTYAGYTAKLEATADAGFVQGSISNVTYGNGGIVSSAAGASAQGYIRKLGAASSVNTSYINASASGAKASGYNRCRIGGTGYIEATGRGALAHGYVRADGETAKITASGRGAVALGHARDLTTNSYITASGDGSGAFGYALNATISASAANAFQFGVGANAQADSLQVGNAGIRMKGTTGAPGTLQNGDIWVASGYMYLRSNGTTRKVDGTDI